MTDPTWQSGSDDGREAIVWLHRLDGNSAMRRLTLTGRNRYPIWLPDGQRVAFQSDREGDAGIFVQRIDGTGAAERLTKAASGEVHVPEAWSPDGRYMLFAVRKGAEYSLWMLSAGDKQVTQVSSVQSREPTGAVFSPDGRWIAYASNPGDGGVRSANRGIFRAALPAHRRDLPGALGYLRFSSRVERERKELVYVPSATSGELAVIDVKTDSGVAFGSATKFPALLTAQRVSSLGRAWDILPDGRFVGLVNVAGAEGVFEHIGAARRDQLVRRVEGARTGAVNHAPRAIERLVDLVIWRLDLRLSEWIRDRSIWPFALASLITDESRNH